MTTDAAIDFYNIHKFAIAMDVSRRYCVMRESREREMMIKILKKLYIYFLKKFRVNNKMVKIL